MFIVLVGLLSCTKTESGRNPCLQPKKFFLRLQASQPADTGSLGEPLNLPSPVIGYVDTNIWFTDGSVAGNTFQGGLSSVADSTRWFIQPDTSNAAGRDTVTFYYERTPVFLSTACGYTIAFSLRDITFTNNSIDSARIDVADVTSDAETINVKVFY